MPYISAVITGRNDGYGENFLLRVNTFIKSLDHQVRNYPDLFEIVLVEWNPPSDTLGMAEVVYKPKNLELRIITVPKEVHDTYNSPTPMLEYAAKNVGLHRARGEFVLTTNPDIIFTQELIDEFARYELQTDTVYRTDRYDYRGEGISELEPSQYVEFARNKVFSGNITVGRLSREVMISSPCPLNDLPKSVITEDIVHTNACGDFIMTAIANYFKVDGMEEAGTYKYHLDSFSLCKLMGIGLRHHVFLSPQCIFHMDHSRNPIKESWNFAYADKLIKGEEKLAPQEQWGLKGIELTEVNFNGT